MRAQLSPVDIRERVAEDIQNPQQSHQEWQVANELTTQSLDHKCKEPKTLLFFRGAIYQFTYNDDGNFSQSQLGLLLQLPSQDSVDNFRKIPIMVAPPGIKVVEFDETKVKHQYITDGWIEKLVGMCPEFTHTVKMHMRGQRKQYGLRHHLTSTVHASMGDTLHKIVTEISSEENDFRLWDKAQAVVLLSRTKLGSDIIFVGNKMETINALASLIQTSNQWMNYMENILEIGSIDREEGDGQVSVFNHQDFPFRISDVIIPHCNTGFVYMLMSIRVPTFCYIGETSNIHVRLNQHNSGYGSQTTIPLTLRPYALLAYVCGFEGNKTLRQRFEASWKRKRDEERMRGVTDLRQIARLGSWVIQETEKAYDVTLRLILNFED